MDNYHDFYSSNPKIFSLKNKNNTEVKIMDWGATILDIVVYIPSTDEFRSLVLGTSPENYSNQQCYMGSTIGRVANRIKNASFKLKGVEYKLDVPLGAKHCLHGGLKGFDKYRFTVLSQGTNNICFSILSPNGDQGFPGNVNLIVNYHLNDLDELTVNYAATSDEQTPLSITNHTYWNLDKKSETNSDCNIYKHKIRVNANNYVELNDQGFPNGKTPSVEDTIFDIRKEKILEDLIKAPVLKHNNGIDNAFVFHKTFDEANVVLKSSDDLVKLEVRTDYPSAQIYTANFFANQPSRLENKPYKDHAGIAIEPSYYPNHANERIFLRDNPLCSPDRPLRRFISYKIITQ